MLPARQRQLQRGNKPNVEYGYDVNSLFEFSAPAETTEAGNGSQNFYDTEEQRREVDVRAIDAAWRHFKTDTRAGRLLRQLYDAPVKPVINYPKVKLNKNINNEKKPKWFAGASRPDQVDPRTKSNRIQREKSLMVPRPKRPIVAKPTPKYVPSRRTKSTIQGQINEIVQEREQFRPRAKKAVATEQEKRKLLAHFQFKGGKALPGGGTLKPINGNIPLSIITGKPDVALHKRQRIKNQQKQAEQRKRNQAEKQKLEVEFDKILNEVEHYRQKLDELALESNNNRAVVKVKEEMRKCVNEMEDIDLRIKQLSL